MKRGSRFVAAVVVVLGVSMACGGTSEPPAPKPEPGEDQPQPEQPAPKKGPAKPGANLSSLAGAYELAMNKSEGRRIDRLRKMTAAYLKDRDSPPADLSQAEQEEWDSWKKDPMASMAATELVEVVDQGIRLDIVEGSGANQLHIFTSLKGEVREAGCGSLLQLGSRQGNQAQFEPHEDTCAPCAGGTLIVAKGTVKWEQQVCEASAPTLKELRFARTR